VLTPEMKELLIAGVDRAVVFGRDEQFVVVLIEEANGNEAAYREYRERVGTLPFCGAFAVVDGVPACRCASSLDAIAVMMLASGAYSRHIAEKIRAQESPKDNSVDWLERLYRLADTRDEFGPA